MRTRGILTMVVTICGLMLMCPLASGQAGEFPAPPYLTSPWKFELAPYVWLPAMDGDITVRGRTADVDLDLGDISTHCWTRSNVPSWGVLRPTRGICSSRGRKLHRSGR